MADFEAGEKIGVNGTPAYFVNGRRMKPGANADSFSKIIEEELAK
jgi:protein-disulfide isomerase